ncbi:MAG: ATP-binding protein [Clostridiaceae bacterium]
MIRIKNQLGRYFTLISIISVIFITIISNLSMNIFFSNYLQNARDIKDLAMIDYIAELNHENQGLDDVDKMSIEHYAFNLTSEVILLDLSGKVQFSTRNPEGVDQGLIDKSDYLDNTKFAYKSYEYEENGKVIGSILVGRPKSIFSTTEDKRFFYTINGIYLIAALFSVVVGAFFKNRLSGTFLKPIYAIQKNTKYIEEGSYSKVSDVGTNTIELSDLSLSINNMALKLEQQENIRKRMTADIAHELRTPLATLNSHIEAFLDGVWEPTPERLVIIQNEITRLTKLIKDLGDLSSLENEGASFEKKEINLSMLFSNIIESFEPLFNSEEITLEKSIKDNIFFSGDADRLNQIFINVVSNALKYTNKGGQVYVEMDEDKDHIHIKVNDNGIGISKEDLPYVFERFYRGDKSRSRETGGKGIGLTITKALVEAHNGTIRITSEPGEGTTVEVEFDKTKD